MLFSCLLMWSCFEIICFIKGNPNKCEAMTQYIILSSFYYDVNNLCWFEFQKNKTVCYLFNYSFIYF